ncbi:MAG: hypothetical protein IT469_12095 [Pseudomonadales bacterium]|nr:hypothetical protein [Pseudomonadales bacterium]
MKTLTIAAVAALLTATAASAEVIRIPVGQQAAEKQVLATPQRGTSKSEVRRRFGEPSRETPAVGDPPISSWEYENYRVYFERDLVLHSVLKGTAAPVPARP